MHKLEDKADEGCYKAKSCKLKRRKGQVIVEYDVYFLREIRFKLEIKCWKQEFYPCIWKIFRENNLLISHLKAIWKIRKTESINFPSNQFHRNFMKACFLLQKINF